MDRHLQSALAQTSMLPSISQPASSSQSLTDLRSLLQGALVQTLLLYSTSPPASLTPTYTDQKVCLQIPTQQLPGTSQLARWSPTDPSLTDLKPTDQGLLTLLGLTLPYVKLVERTAFLAWSLRQSPTCQTDLQLNCLRRRANFQMTRTLLSQNNRLQRNRPTGRP